MLADNDKYINHVGKAPNTRVAISGKNKIYAVGARSKTYQRLGVVSTFDPSESRAVDPIRGIGHGDQVAELVPGATEPMQLSLNRTMLYLANAYQVLGYNSGIDGVVRSLKHHQWPFDIKQELVFSALANYDAISKSAASASINSGFKPASEGSTGDQSGAYALITLYEACWINSYSTSYSADTASIVENLSITVSDVVDGTSTYYATKGLDNTFATGNNPFNTEVKGSKRYQTS